MLRFARHLYLIRYKYNIDLFQCEYADFMSDLGVLQSYWNFRCKGTGCKNFDIQTSEGTLSHHQNSGLGLRPRPSYGYIIATICIFLFISQIKSRNDHFHTSSGHSYQLKTNCFSDVCLWNTRAWGKRLWKWSINCSHKAYTIQ